MLRRNHVGLLATVLLGGALVAGCAAPDEDLAGLVGSTRAPLIQAESAVPGQYIVMLKSGQVSAASVNALANRVNLRGDESRVVRSYSIIPGFAARLSQPALQDVLNDPSVAYVEENGRVSLNTIHDSNGANGIDRVDQRELPLDGLYNDFGNDGAGVDVYIVDTGIRSTHNEFTGRVGGLADFVGGDGEDCNGHGTHVASTAAGTQFGLAKAATVHGVRVLNCQGSGTFAGVIAGIDFVAQDCSGSCVANMSLGGGFSQSVNDAVASAVSAGVTFAVAAGNESQDACNTSPASEPAALTVGAMNPVNDAVASFSNFGSCVDIFAPGVSILGADIGSDSDTQTISGTSMASPHVAGVAALFLGANPGASPSQVEQALEGVAGVNCVSGVGGGSPNLLLHNDFNAGSFECDGGGEPPVDSCEGFCGGQAPAGCFCDKSCKRFGDCCPDKRDVCGRN